MRSAAAMIDDDADQDGTFCRAHAMSSTVRIGRLNGRQYPIVNRHRALGTLARHPAQLPRPVGAVTMRATRSRLMQATWAHVGGRESRRNVSIVTTSTPSSLADRSSGRDAARTVRSIGTATKHSPYQVEHSRLGSLPRSVPPPKCWQHRAASSLHVDDAPARRVRPCRAIGQSVLACCDYDPVPRTVARPRGSGTPAFATEHATKNRARTSQRMFRARYRASRRGYHPGHAPHVSLGSSPRRSP